MKNTRKSRRTAIGVALSTAFHLFVLVMVINQVAPDYQLPEAYAPPMDVRIMPMEEPPPKPVIIERLPPLKPEPVKPQPPKPEPPKSQPPQPQPPKPEPPKPAPPKPTAAPPTPAPPKPVAAAPTAPTATPRVEARPTPAPPLPQAPPAPPAPKAAPTPPAPPSPMHLNIHKPDKEAPNGVATLPFAPAPARPAGGPPPGASAGEPELGGSRLQGLNPYPAGSMPGGGTGLRGTLVGCANADAVSLSSVERARCNERFGAHAGSAPALDPISPLKRAAFDKAAAQDAAERKYREGMPVGTGPNHGLGSDQPMSVGTMIKGGGPQ